MGEARRKAKLKAAREAALANGTRLYGSDHYPYKRDTGILKLSSGVPLTEETRDKLAKIDGPRRKLETPVEQKTSRELEEEQWSGLRNNPITMQTEIWVLGTMRKKIPTDQLEKSPALLAAAFEEVFATNGSIIEIDAPVPPAIFK